MDGSRYFLIERSQSRHNTFIIKQNILFDRESKAKQYRVRVENLTSDFLVVDKRLS